MRTSAWHKVVNPLLLVALLAQAITGLGMMLFHWEAVEEAHEWGGILLVGAGVVHVILNRRWLRVAYRRGS